MLRKEDGSAEKMNKAMTLMGKFCRESRKPPELFFACCIKYF